MVNSIRKYCGAFGAIGWSVLCALVMTGLAAVGQTIRARAIMPMWGKGVLLCFGTRFSVSGLEQLPACNFIAAVSHHSLLDTFIYPAILPPETCYIAKSELSRLPIFSKAFRLLGRNADRLRLRDLITHPRAQAPRDLVDEVSAYAALISPLASIRVLSRALELDEEGLRHILNDAGWVELEEHPQGGARFAPPDPLTWRSALLEGGARAHLCAAALMRALTDVYLGAPPLEERAALQRLSALRGRGAYREPNRFATTA